MLSASRQIGDCADGVGLRLERVPMKSNHLPSVMPALVAGIHVFLAATQQARRGWPGQARPRRIGEVVQHDPNPLYAGAMPRRPTNGAATVSLPSTILSGSAANARVVGPSTMAAASRGSYREL